MRVQIDHAVHLQIDEFYMMSMQLHPTLDEATVEAKKNRLYEAVRAVGMHPTIYPMARVRKDWVEQGYREMICEDFHFAFDLVDLEDGETIVYIFDAIHSLLNY